MTKNCIICRKEFHIKPCNINRSKCCSRKCAGKYANNFKIKKERAKVICKYCGKIKFIKKSKEKEFKYCSRICHAKSVFNNKGSNSSCWKGGKKKRICMICKKEYYVKIGKYEGSKCCSKICLGKLNRGKNHYNWKGGISDLRDKIRRLDEYTKWRQAIFIRDDFTCKDCGKQGGNLEAHHIKPFSIILAEIKHNLPLIDLLEACRIYTPLWDIENGKTLCEKCHKIKTNKFLSKIFSKGIKNES